MVKIKQVLLCHMENSSEEGQRIRAENLPNACVVEINLDDNKTSLYASGIRNIKGWDLDSEGKLIAIVGGMETKGAKTYK